MCTPHRNKCKGSHLAVGGNADVRSRGVGTHSVVSTVGDGFVAHEQHSTGLGGILVHLYP